MIFLTPHLANCPAEIVLPHAPKKTGPLFLTYSAPNSLKARVPLAVAKTFF